MATAQLDESQGHTESHQTQITATGGALRVMIQTSSAATNYTSPSFVQVTAGNITIPAGTQGILVGTFTAESRCTGTGGSFCSVRIVCNGVELAPASGTDFAFNSPNDLWKSLSVTRRSNNLGPGTYTCRVQTAQVGGSNHHLDDWLFKVELWRTL
jgi:hypothetical protein